MTATTAREGSDAAPLSKVRCYRLLFRYRYLVLEILRDRRIARGVWGDAGDERRFREFLVSGREPTLGKRAALRITDWLLTRHPEIAEADPMERTHFGRMRRC